jgi:hypothetical protein
MRLLLFVTGFFILAWPRQSIFRLFSRINILCEPMIAQLLSGIFFIFFAKKITLVLQPKLKLLFIAVNKSKKQG